MGEQERPVPRSSIVHDLVSVRAANTLGVGKLVTYSAPPYDPWEGVSEEQIEFMNSVVFKAGIIPPHQMWQEEENEESARNEMEDM